MAGLAHAFLTVLDSYHRTMTDAHHAVGAISVPDRLAVLNRDVVGGTETGALATANAGITAPKALSLKRRGYKRPDLQGRS